jgi:PKD repeat protein
MIVGSVASMSAEPPPTPTPPIANFDWSPRDPFQGSLVSFVDQTLQDPTSWSWALNGSEFSNQQNPSLYFPFAGVFTITLTATNSFGSDTATANITVST